MARDTMYSIGHQLSDKSVVALKTPPHAGFGPDGPRFWSRRCQKHRECPAFGRPVSQTSPRIRKKELKTLRGAGPALPAAPSFAFFERWAPRAATSRSFVTTIA